MVTAPRYGLRWGLQLRARFAVRGLKIVRGAEGSRAVRLLMSLGFQTLQARVQIGESACRIGLKEISSLRPFDELGYGAASTIHDAADPVQSSFHAVEARLDAIESLIHIAEPVVHFLFKGPKQILD